MSILIGSRAAKLHRPELWSSCRDTDLITTFDEFSNWYQSNQHQIKACFPFDKGKKFYVEFDNNEIVEAEIAHPNSTAESLINLVEGSIVNSDTLGMPGIPVSVLVPTMDWLFTIKSSHKYLKDNPHFEKTIRDYHTMKSLGCKIANEEWFKAREKETYTRPRPNLNRSKKDFFSGDSVSYVHDHDSLHVAIARYGFNDRPAYTYYMKDGAEVMSSKKKWDACSEEIKMRGAIEECYVLALERSQIPYRNEITPLDSFKISISKVCSSITSGWFRGYVYENYYKILDMYTDDYVSWFDQGIKDNVVKPFS